MNKLQLKSWSERQQVVAIILLAGLLIFLLWFFLLTPLNRKRRGLERDIDGMRRELEQKNLLLGESVLRKKKQSIQRRNRDLNGEWSAIVERVAAFSGPEDLPPTEVGHIDYKVALFDVRHRLLKKSREMRISLPHDLGMEDAVHSDADARKLMLQLRAVEKLVDLTLDAKISMLRNIVPLTPVHHIAGPGGEVFLEEFPVRVEFYATRENIYELFRAILMPGQVFAMRNLRVETAARGRQQLLSVTAEMSALVFLKNPEELDLAPSGGLIRTGPLGH